MKNLFSASAEALGPLQPPHQIQPSHRKMKGRTMEYQPSNEVNMLYHS